MKTIKISIALFTALFFASCGGNDTAATEEVTSHEEVVSVVEEKVEEVAEIAEETAVVAEDAVVEIVAEESSPEKEASDLGHQGKSMLIQSSGKIGQSDNTVKENVDEVTKEELTTPKETSKLTM